MAKSVVPYHREDELRRRLNGFLCEVLAVPPEDYYGRLDLRTLLKLKSALADVNNVLTMRLTFSFLAWAGQALSLDEASLAVLRDQTLGSKPSSNGYDIHCRGSTPFIAEVKCNIPVNGGGRYGDAQKTGVLSDITALINGKSKSATVDERSLKFMVFIDLPEVRAANRHLQSGKSLVMRRFMELAKDEVPSNPEVVYGVYLALEA